MAKRRMFSLDVVDTDKFLNMPPSTQALYYNLGMRADDDGFVSSPRKIALMSNCGTDDLNILVSKGYLIPFDSGVVVITDWKINNWIRSERHTETHFRNEYNALCINDSGAYCINDSQSDSNVSVKCQLNDSQTSAKCQPQVSIGKDSIDKVSINNIYTPDSTENKKPVKHKYGKYNHVLLTDTERDRMIGEYGQSFFDRCVKRLDEYIEQTGKKYKNHNLAMRNWVVNAVKEDIRKEKGCTGATNNRFNNFHQRENNLTDEELEMMLTDNNKKAPQ